MGPTVLTTAVQYRHGLSFSHIVVIKVNMNKGDAAENGRTMRNRRKFLRHIILEGEL
jgi:hypothetical protein